jgi:3',5'-cyclic AMP phosphodiesterase CpdA
VSSTILHVSDLHFGAGNGLDDPALEQGIAALVERVAPDVIVASGDLTHRGLEAEHESAASYLRALGRPLLVIPGNHDIPPWPPRRFMRPYRQFERIWETTNPSFSAPGLEIAGLCSVQPFGYQRGHVRGADLELAESRLRRAPAGALRVAVLHHQLTGSPWRNTKLPLKGRTRVLKRLAGAGAELILGGHIHQSLVVERREFEVVRDDPHTCVLAVAPGLGRPRPSRAFEARGILVHRADENTLTTEVHVWRDDAWALTGSRTFPRGV